jgi:lipopolysaccharide biosynthesis protein
MKRIIMLTDKKNKTLLALGNRAMRLGEYGTAIDYYISAFNEQPTLRFIIEKNLNFIKLKNKLDSKSLAISNIVKIKIDENFLKKLEKNDLFNAQWYINKYSLTILKSNKKEALLHYIYIGTEKNLNPSKKFNTKYYRYSNPDIASSKEHPFIHYVNQGINENRAALPMYRSITTVDQHIFDSQYIPYRKNNLSVNISPAKIICFYLPQFHPIQENNQWWGEGFTEWTNVRPAQPKFEGHYQPHVPDLLGYYNLLDIEVQRKQVDLAKNYGIAGFCFYYYWFDGKRLLEKPVENYLHDESLDLPFCLCWANENWSRRWDGLENDILIGQNHSPEDDIDFIKSLFPYITDNRYIKIDDKPLILVYRPGLFPDPFATAKRWRIWCRENGVGEIHLAFTHSFELVSPEVYGYDSAVEFPPNNSNIPDITNKMHNLDANFEGVVYQWNELVKRSNNYVEPGYKIFRSVCPSWDNSARKRNKASILYGSSPREYQNWLFNAIKDSEKRWEKNNRLVFVNAWNEWAEGAHLEPDNKYGFGYLEATSIALQKANLSISKELDKMENDILAVAIHCFYIDVLEEIMNYISIVKGLSVKLYVTCPYEIYEATLTILQAYKIKFECIITENRGRDILPFFKIYPNILRGGHRLILKLHTKKSKHRKDGDSWRSDLYQKLIHNQKILDICDLFKLDKNIGILGPVDHIIPMDAYWGSNEQQVLKLSSRFGLCREQVLNVPFIAGSMFFIRTSALSLLVDIISEDDFEMECGQIDGTYAHAIERFFTILIESINLKILDSNLTSFESINIVNYDYKFADIN